MSNTFVARTGRLDRWMTDKHDRVLRKHDQQWFCPSQIGKQASTDRSAWSAIAVPLTKAIFKIAAYLLTAGYLCGV